MSDFEQHANPEMVDAIIQVVGRAINGAVIPGVTTQSDLLSAIFTILHRMLKMAKEMEDPAHHERNTKEIGDILMNFLFEFGTPGKPQ